MQEVVYTMQVHRGDADDLWAEVEELPGCRAAGANIEELEQALLEAMSLYLSRGNGRVAVQLASGQHLRADDAESAGPAAQRTSRRCLVTAC